MMLTEWGEEVKQSGRHMWMVAKLGDPGRVSVSVAPLPNCLEFFLKCENTGLQKRCGSECQSFAS